MSVSKLVSSKKRDIDRQNVICGAVFLIVSLSVVFAIINNDAEDLLLTLCGWSIDTIIESFAGGKEI